MIKYEKMVTISIKMWKLEIIYFFNCHIDSFSKMTFEHQNCRYQYFQPVFKSLTTFSGLVGKLRTSQNNHVFSDKKLLNSLFFK